MLDEIAIQQTINRYTEGASRADWDQVMSTFLPDGVWEIPGLGVRHQGHAAIRAAMAAFVGQMAYFVQINSPAIITVEGAKARTRTVIRECGKFADRDEALEVLGFYNDDLLRTTEGWKFTCRAFKAVGMHTFPLVRNPPAGG
ncbi:MAG TPA: nuclear transport factor 2 family protein [Steroidobacteraceae bacterium]|nr:nuclear transport factor 2 family protein [Steroidobacteraceae bacterium]